MYISNHNLKFVSEYLPLSSFAFELGINNKDIEKSAVIYNKLLKNNKSGKFEEYLKNKTIAVVGNGGFELGKGKGSEKDSHDIVIRFNNYPFNYEIDYGVKTNMWARCDNRNIEERGTTETYDFIIWQQNVWRTVTLPRTINVLDKYLQTQPEKIFCIPKEIREIIAKSFRLYNPSTGALVLQLLKDKLDNFSKVDIYGFSFPHEKVSTGGHYYDNLSTMQVDHSMAEECRFMRNIYYSNGGTCPPYSQEIKEMDK